MGSGVKRKHWGPGVNPVDSFHKLSYVFDKEVNQSILHDPR